MKEKADLARYKRYFDELDAGVAHRHGINDESN